MLFRKVLYRIEATSLLLNLVYDLRYRFYGSCCGRLEVKGVVLECDPSLRSDDMVQCLLFEMLNMVIIARDQNVMGCQLGNNLWFCKWGVFVFLRSGLLGSSC